jgi:tRNA pseudouridine55 synthase
MEGFVNLNKPAGPTSHDMVNRVRRLLHVRRVGHGGTLDPIASGVLPIGVGPATRLLSFLQEGEKVYRATVRLGISTTTYDAAGEVTAERPLPPLEWAGLEQALAPFLGAIEQTPPPFSAVRRGGQRLYQRARAGEVVSPPPRQVHIFRLTLMAWESPHLTVEVVCSSGTYIRSLAHDLGQRLGCGAHLSGLVRRQVGPFRIAEAVTTEQLAEAVERGEVASLLLPLDLPVRHWPAVQVDEQQARGLVNGRPLALEVGSTTGWARAYDPAGRLLALLQLMPESGCWQPRRVFPPAPAEREGS